MRYAASAALAAALALSAGALAQAPVEHKGKPGETGTAPAGSLSSGDKRFIEKAARDGMAEVALAQLAKEHGLSAFDPPPFSVLKYQKEIERLERAYNTHFNTLWNMVSKAKFALMKRFFETIASRVKHVYVIANRDAEAWLKAVMSPLETQVREHHIQLRRRLDSIKRIHQASGELEERIEELTQQADAVRTQMRGLERKVAEIDAIVAAPDLLPVAANG